MGEWYVYMNGEQTGPLSQDDLLARLRSDPEGIVSALVWRDGMADWVSPEAAGLLSPRTSSVAPGSSLPHGNHMLPTSSQPAAASPYQPPRTLLQPGLSDSYPGVNRLVFILGSVGVFFTMGMAIAIMVAVAEANGTGGDPEFENLSLPGIIVIICAGIGALIVLGVQRVRNTGKSGWWYLAVLIPFYNIWVQLVMVAAPAGFRDTNRFDRAGKILAGCYIGYLILSIVLNIIGSFAFA